MRQLSAGWRQITGKGREGELVLFNVLELNQFSFFTDSHNYLNGFPPQILLCLGVTVVTKEVRVWRRRLGRGYYDRRGGEKSAAGPVLSHDSH